MCTGVVDEMSIREVSSKKRAEASGYNRSVRNIGEHEMRQIEPGGW